MQNAQHQNLVGFIWNIANKLRGSYMPDKYGDVIIPMTILRRLECALEPHKEAVLAKFAENPNYPPKAMYRISGYQFYNTSPYTLKELCNEPDNIKSNFKVYIQGFSAEVQEIFNGLEMFSHIDKMWISGSWRRTRTTRPLPLLLTRPIRPRPARI